MPLARIAVFRVIAYLFIPIDVFVTTSWVRAHADVPTEWYAPLLIGRVLHLPTPTHTVVLVVQWALVVAAVLAASGRAPRLLGTAVFVLYAEWMVIAMSYGKVDHDRIAFLVALAVLPTVGGGPVPGPPLVGVRRLRDGRGAGGRDAHLLPRRLGEDPLRRLGLADGRHADPCRGAPGHRPVHLDPGRAVPAAGRAVG